MGYFQLADSPDRHEPGTGELNYTRVLQCGRAIVDEFHIPFTAQAGVTERPAQHHRTQTVEKNALPTGYKSSIRSIPLALTMAAWGWA